MTTLSTFFVALVGGMVGAVISSMIMAILHERDEAALRIGAHLMMDREGFPRQDGMLVLERQKGESLAAFEERAGREMGEWTEEILRRLSQNEEEEA